MTTLEQLERAWDAAARKRKEAVRRLWTAEDSEKLAREIYLRAWDESKLKNSCGRLVVEPEEVPGGD